MNPTVLHIGRFALSSYTALLDAGVLLALAVFGLRAQTRVARPARWWDGVLLALVGGVLGGRLAYVAANWSYYGSHSGRILKFWQGGLSWHGAFFGAALMLGVYCRLRRLDFWRLADELALMLPIIGVGAGLGCLMVGCAYGREVVGPNVLAAELPDLFGVELYRYNVALLIAGWSLLVFVILWGVGHLRPRALRSGLFLLLFCGGLAILDSMRADSVPLLGGWRLDVLLDGLLAVAGMILVVCSIVRERRARRIGVVS